MVDQAEYQISSSVVNDGFLEFVVTGNAIGSDFEKMINEVDSIIKANNTKKAIFDIRTLEGRLERTEIYRFVRNYPSVIYDIQCAMVDLPENVHYKTASKNAGLSLEWFTDIDTARAWIKNK
jgi:hypothetical protein